MKIIKADNYQTWYIEHLDSAILIDPWLTNTLQPDRRNFFLFKDEKKKKKKKVQLVYQKIKL